MLLPWVGIGSEPDISIPAEWRSSEFGVSSEAEYVTV